MAVKRRFINTEELAEYIGVSANTIYYWVSSHQIPHYKLGAKLKFDIAELDKWLADRKVDCLHSPCQTTGKPDNN